MKKSLQPQVVIFNMTRSHVLREAVTQTGDSRAGAIYQHPMEPGAREGALVMERKVVTAL